ncbi:MAG: hypothetical protein ACKPKO_15820, partial [Candidatus Fonsibacter sp.]
MASGRVVTTMTYDMEDVLRSCIQQYQSVVGSKSPLRNYVTDFLSEDHRLSPAGKLGAGPVKECPWCFHTGSPSSLLTYSSVDKLPVRRRPKVETSAEDPEHDG